MSADDKLYHVTVLSNFARGFDKYSHSYSKSHIPESTYPDRFFLLRRYELGTGVNKAAPLLKKIGLVGNRLIVLETDARSLKLHPNIATGRGQFIYSHQITLTGLYDLNHDGNPVSPLNPLTVEDAMAVSLRLLNKELLPFASIR